MVDPTWLLANQQQQYLSHKPCLHYGVQWPHPVSLTSHCYVNKCNNAGENHSLHLTFPVLTNVRPNKEMGGNLANWSVNSARFLSTTKLKIYIYIASSMSHSRIQLFKPFWVQLAFTYIATMHVTLSDMKETGGEVFLMEMNGYCYNFMYSSLNPSAWEYQSTTLGYNYHTTRQSGAATV